MNVDLKEFLDKDKRVIFSGIKNDKIREDLININKLGLFFWERGGKQFVKNYCCFALNCKAKGLSVFEYSNLVVKEKTALGKTILFAQDFLDCVACLGEEKVKELIKECEKIND